MYCISAQNTDIAKIKIGHSSLISKGLALWRNQANSKNKWSWVERVKPPLTINPKGVKTLWSSVVSVCDYYQLWRRICSCWWPGCLHLGGGEGVDWPHHFNSSARPHGNPIMVLCSLVGSNRHIWWIRYTASIILCIC